MRSWTYHLKNKTRALQFLVHHKPERDVICLVNQKQREEIFRIRAALGSIIETLKFAAVQNISLRGHRDSCVIEPSGTYPN